MSDLKNELASLRLEEEPARSRRGVWIGLILIVVAAVSAFAWRATASLRAVEVETVTPTVEQVGSAAAGTPVLTASGYIVARREAVVSSKIQGRLLELRVEEGSEVKDGRDSRPARERRLRGPLGAPVRSSSRPKRHRVAEAAIHRAEADLAEAERQLGVTKRLNADKLVPDRLARRGEEPRAIAEAALGAGEGRRDASAAARSSRRPTSRSTEAQLNNTIIRAPFAGTVVKKMAEVGESVAPIPPGVNISTASGAIVALADLATLEMEADVSEANVAKLATNSRPRYRSRRSRIGATRPSCGRSSRRRTARRRPC